MYYLIIIINLNIIIAKTIQFFEFRNNFEFHRRV